MHSLVFITIFYQINSPNQNSDSLSMLRGIVNFFQIINEYYFCWCNLGESTLNIEVK